MSERIQLPRVCTDDTADRAHDAQVEALIAALAGERRSQSQQRPASNFEGGQMESAEETAEYRAQTIIDDYNRALNAVLKLRASIDEANGLPPWERRAVSQVLDPVGRLMTYRAPGDTSRPLIHRDFVDLREQFVLAMNTFGELVERTTILGDDIPVERTAPGKSTVSNGKE